MKLAHFSWNDRSHLGLVDEAKGVIRRLDLASDSLESEGLACLIAAPLPPVTGELPLPEVELLAPIPRPKRNIFCVGKNYYDHAQEFASSGFDSSAAKGAVPEAPIVFSKVPESVIGPGDPIRIDASVSNAVDYEVELAVIIGREGRNIPAPRALTHVWGYTVVNDVTAQGPMGQKLSWDFPISHWLCRPWRSRAVTSLTTV